MEIDMSETIFDKILNKEIPADVVYEDEDVLAFRDINPQAPVHVLVIPKIKVEKFSELQDAPSDWVGKYFSKAALVASELELDENGYRVVINNGKHGQQSVDYIHIHLLGGKQLSWPPG